jgi:DNA-binding SARP family transcriptional activator/pimeloyl-ACP methyl ester carboxylesterase
LSGPTLARTIELRLLGRFEVRVGEAVIIDASWRAAKAKALLKLVALAPNRSLHREQALDVLWPDLDPQAAAANLRQALHQLRSALSGAHVDAPLIERHEDLLMLAPNVSVDVEVFRRAAKRARELGDGRLYEEALSAYGGELLAEDRYEEWTIGERDALSALHQDVLLESAGALEDAGDIDAAGDRLRQLIALEPANESAHRSLMLLFARAGQRDRALRQFESARQALDRWLGVEPSQETRELHEQISRGDVASSGVTTRVPRRTARLGGAQPAIRYTRTSDGVNIAFWTLGEGPALVVVPTGPLTHCQLEWELPGLPNWHQRMSARNMLVRYDNRGSGLSDRAVADCHLSSLTRDLAAVADRLENDRVSLFAHHAGALPALLFAAEHPERVARLVLWCPWSHRVHHDSRMRTLTEMIDKDWEFFALTIAYATFGPSGTAGGDTLRRMILKATTPATMLSFLESVRDFDLPQVLPRVPQPTLLLYRRDLPDRPDSSPQDAAVWLAAHLPNARVMGLEGNSPAHYLGDFDSVVAAVESFLSEDNEAER